MTPLTEVIACPACKHLLRVPVDWLGTPVQCPECQALFRAPVREGGKLTEPQLLSRPATTSVAQPRRDGMLLLPAFGLLLCGVAGTLVNAVLLYKFVSEPDGAIGWARKQMPALRQLGFGTPGTPAEEAAENEQNAQQLARVYQILIPISLAVSLFVFVGGLSMVRRRHYWLTQAACLLASVNIAHACCIPGAVAGLWGLLMLNSDEGRDHFL